MPEYGPGGKWAVMTDLKADPGGSMAVIESEAYRAPCAAHNPGMPIYTRAELDMIKRLPHSAAHFRGVQKIKRVFAKARVVDIKIKKEEAHGQA